MNELRDPEIVELREAYLAEVSRLLYNRVSAVEAFETVREMRQHLDASASAHVEVGVESRVAMRAAIESFGSARSIARGIARSNGTVELRWPLATRLVLVAAFGGAAMIWLDYFGWLVHLWSGTDPQAELAIGAVFALITALVAWRLRPSPIRFGLCWGAGIGTFLCLMLSPAVRGYHSLFHPLCVIACVAWTGLGISYVAAKLVQSGPITLRVRRRFG